MSHRTVAGFFGEHKEQKVNIYMIVEDGEHCIYQAETFEGALQIAEQIFIADQDNDWDGDCPIGVYFRNKIVESCQLIGELRNPTYTPIS